MPAGIKANPDGSAAIQVGGTDVITLTSGGAATFVTSPTTVQAGTAAAPSITFSGDADTGIFSPGANTLAFSTNGTEDARFDSSGRLLVGTTTAIGSWGSAKSQELQIAASGATYPGLSAYAFSTNTGAGGMINLGRSRSTTVGTIAATQSSDVLGYLIFEGANSSNALTGGGYIDVVQTAAAGASYIPAAMRFYTSDTTNGTIERARFNSSGAFVLAGGDVAANGIGITFPATQSASSNANTLDDYEEGTWTPQLQFGNANVGMTGIFSGRYTKIGNVVTLNAFVQLSSKGSSTGGAQIANLPFNPVTISQPYATATIYVTGLITLSSGQIVAPNINGTITKIDLNGVTTTTGVDFNLTQGNFNSSGTFWLNATYITNT